MKDTVIDLDMLVLEHQYIEGYVRCLESRGVEWDEYRSVEHM